MGGSPLERGEGRVLGLCVGLLVVACASPVSRVDGRWRAAEGGASVLDLAALEPGWRRRPDEGPLLAYEAADAARAWWLRRCPGATAAARAEAHALLIRLPNAEVRAEQGVPLAGSEAWVLWAEASREGRPVAIKAVTRAAAGCTDDFLLVSPGSLAAHEAAFDRWWASYQAGSPP